MSKGAREKEKVSERERDQNKCSIQFVSSHNTSKPIFAVPNILADNDKVIMTNPKKQTHFEIYFSFAFRRIKKEHYGKREQNKK